MIFIDTNYFVRFLLRDVESQYKKARQLFEDGAKKKKKLFTSTIVVFEIYWLFISFYKKPKQEVIEIINKLFDLDFIKIKEKDELVQALGLFKEANFDLEDCYNFVYAETNKADSFKTFDKKLGRFIKSQDI